MKAERRVGTVSRGIRCPIFREGDNLAEQVVESVLEAAESDGFEILDRDVIGVTESVVARCQGNYASVNDIAEDVKNNRMADSFQKQILHLPEGHGNGRQEGCCNAQLSVR